MRLFKRQEDKEKNAPTKSVSPPATTRRGCLGFFRRPAKDEPTSIAPSPEIELTPPTEEELTKKARFSIFSRKKAVEKKKAVEEGDTLPSRKRIAVGIMGNLLLLLFVCVALVNINFYALFQRIIKPMVAEDNPTLASAAISREFMDERSQTLAEIQRVTMEAQETVVMAEVLAAAQQAQVERYETVVQRQATESYEVTSTQAAALYDRTATAMLIEQTSIAFAMSHHSTSTSIAADAALSENIRQATATQEAQNMQSASIARTMKEQAGQSTGESANTGNCTSPAFIFGLVIVAAVVRQRHP